MTDETVTLEQVTEQIRTAERAFDFTNDQHPWWLASLRVLLDENNMNVDLREQLRVAKEGWDLCARRMKAIETAHRQAMKVSRR